MADGTTPSPSHSPEAVFVGAAVVHAVGALVARSTLDDTDSGAVTLVGLLAAAIILLVVAAIRRPHHDDHPALRASAPSTRIAVVVFGAAVGATAVCTALALDRLAAREASALLFAGPILLAAWRVRSAIHAVAVGLAAIGVALVAGLHNGDARATGLLAGASVAWAFLIVAGHRVATSQASSSFALPGALVIAAAVAAPFGAGHIGDIADQPRLLVLACLVGILVAGIALPLELWVLGRVPTDRYGVLVVLVPVVTAFFAYVALDETPTAPDIIGTAFVVAAVALDAVRRSPASRR